MDADAPTVEEAVRMPCVWDHDVMFADQLKLLQTLQRIAEHFVAAAASSRPDRARDAASIIVMGCITAVADAVMRRRALDEPSEACSHLMGACVRASVRSCVCCRGGRTGSARYVLRIYGKCCVV